MTKTKTVDGFVLYKDKSLPIQKKVTILYTKDAYGKTLSLSDNNFIMISVAFEEIEDLMK